MKKILIATLLVVVFALSLTLAACSSPVAKIEVKEGTIESSYNKGDTIDYNKGILIVTYEDETTAEVKFTDKGVKYTPVNTSKAGSQTLIVTYGGKTAQFPIEIVDDGVIENVTVRTFKHPDSYQNYLARSADNTGNDDAFKRVGAVYKVGSVNKFQYSPIAEYFDDNMDLQAIGENVLTTMKLSVKSEPSATYTQLSDDQAATYVTKEGNFYKFNGAVANDQYFKMEVSLDTNAYQVSDTLSQTTLTIEFLVVDAYNAYNIFGLSVYDNLNVNHWAVQKNRTLKWDDKKLSEYTDVTEVILHDDIEIDPDNLPSEYFWQEGMQINLQNSGGNKEMYQSGWAAAKSYFDTHFKSVPGAKLEGSLIDGVGDTAKGIYRLYAGVVGGSSESYNVNTKQKALFMTNQCSLSGNYMSVSAIEGESASGRQLVTYVTDERSGNNPKSHWAFFGPLKTDAESTLELFVENVDITGNMHKQEVSDGIAAGMMGIITGTDALDIVNVNMRTCYTHVVVISNSDYVSEDSEYGSSAITLTDSNLTDAYSNMIYLWRTHVTITNSALKDAGGPLFIMVDGSTRYESNRDSNSGALGRKCQLIVDDKSVLESYASGSESWYTVFNAKALFTKLIEFDGYMKNDVGVTVQHDNENATVGGAESLINLIAVICPEIGDIQSTATNEAKRIWIKGDFIRTNGSAKEIYSMEDQMYWNQIRSQDTVLVKCGNDYAFMNSTTSFMKATAWTNPSDLMCLYMNVNKMLPAGAPQYAPYFGIILGGVQKVSA